MIHFDCPSCGKQLKAKDEYMGKRAKCPGCGQVRIIPGPVRDVRRHEEPAQGTSEASAKQASPSAPLTLAAHEISAPVVRATAAPVAELVSRPTAARFYHINSGKQCGP